MLTLWHHGYIAMVASDANCYQQAAIEESQLNLSACNACNILVVSKLARNMLKHVKWNTLLHTVKFLISKNVNNPLLAYIITLKFHFVFRLKTWSYNIVHCHQYNTSIVATKKHPLSDQMPQCVHRAWDWCSNVAIDNALWGWKIGENRGKNGCILTFNELYLTFWVPVYVAKSFIKIEQELRLKDRWQTDTGEFIVCPMLCYSSGTDNKWNLTPA